MTRLSCTMDVSKTDSDNMCIVIDYGCVHGKVVIGALLPVGYCQGLFRPLMHTVNV